MATSVLPRKIKEAEEEYNKLVKDGYPLDYLNVEYNISEANKKISDILDRSKVLNLEDSLFELKVLSDYFDALFTDFDKEKINRSEYEDANQLFSKKLEKSNTLMHDILDSFDKIKSLYNLSEDELGSLTHVFDDLEALNNDYKILLEHIGNQTFAYSKLTKEIEGLSVRLSKIDETVDNVLNSIDSMKDDEVRARQQLEEIKLILKDSKDKIYKLYHKTILLNLMRHKLLLKKLLKNLRKSLLQLTF